MNCFEWILYCATKYEVSHCKLFLCACVYTYLHSDIAEAYFPSKAEVSTQAVCQCHDQQDPHFLHATIEVYCVKRRRAL